VNLSLPDTSPVRRRDLTGYAGLSHIRATGILSAFIGVISALIGDEKTSSSFFYTDIRR
jgi:hypothetical protein